MVDGAQNNTTLEEPQEQKARKLAAKRGPGYKGPFMSTVHFRQTLDRCARARQQLQGRTLDRQTLADIWGLKEKGGIVSETLRAAVDFGFFDVNEADQYQLTDLGISLIYTEVDTPGMVQVRRRGRASLSSHG